MFFGPFIKNWCWKVAKASPWVLLFVPTSLYQWCHKQNWHMWQKYQICHFFCYSLVKSKATWLCPEECKFKVVKKKKKVLVLYNLFLWNKQMKPADQNICTFSTFSCGLASSVQFLFQSKTFLNTGCCSCRLPAHEDWSVLYYHYFVLIVVATIAFKDPWSKSWVH